MLRNVLQLRTLPLKYTKLSEVNLCSLVSLKVYYIYEVIK